MKQNPVFIACLLDPFEEGAVVTVLTSLVGSSASRPSAACASKDIRFPLAFITTRLDNERIGA